MVIFIFKQNPSTYCQLKLQLLYVASPVTVIVRVGTKKKKGEGLITNVYIYNCGKYYETFLSDSKVQANPCCALKGFKGV